MVSILLVDQDLVFWCGSIFVGVRKVWGLGISDGFHYIIGHGFLKMDYTRVDQFVRLWEDQHGIRKW